MPKKFDKNPDSLLSTAYQKLDARINEPFKKEASEWTITDSLVYICKGYKEKFGFNFTLSYKDSPSTSPEYKLCKRLWMMLEANKNDGVLVKEYIDYFYKNYSGKTHFVSIGALAHNKRIAAFRKYKDVISRPTKATPLPEKFLAITTQYEETSYIKTYGDLAFLKQAMLEDDEPPEAFRLMFSGLKRQGLKTGLLDEVI